MGVKHLGTVAFLLLAAGRLPAGEAKPVVSPRSYWRYHWTFRPARFLNHQGKLIAIHTRYAALNTVGAGNQLTTARPPKGWTGPGFDDSGWPVSRAPLPVLPDIDQDGGGPYSNHIIRVFSGRVRFLVPDPGGVRGLKLELRYYGGAIVYVNGRELARGHIAKDGALAKEFFAEPYPQGAYRATGKTAPKGLGRGWYGAVLWHDWRLKGALKEGAAQVRAIRERRLSVEVPAKILRKGVNILAVENRLSPVIEFATKRKGKFTLPKNRNRWPHVGISHLALKPTPAGAVRDADSRPAGVQAWSEDIHRWMLEEDFLEPGVKQRRTIELVGARGGSYSGQVVIGTDRDLSAPSAKLSDLAGPGGAKIPASAVKLRWARPLPIKLIKKTNPGSFRTYMQDLYLIRYRGAITNIWPIFWSGPGEAQRRVRELWARDTMRIYDQLAPHAPAKIAAGKSQPLWLTVEIPEGAPAGEYKGKLSVRAGGATEFDVRMEVVDWKLTAPKRYVAYVGVDESPWALAKWTETKLWSEQHWKLMEQSVEWAGKLGARVAGIPVIHRTELNNETDTMIKWVKKPGGGFDFDFKLADKYLDIWKKHCHAESDVIVYLAHPSDVYGRGGGTGTVTVRDPATGKESAFTPPQADTPEGRKLWIACARAIHAHLKARGWKDRNIHWGLLYDHAGPRHKAFALALNSETPGVGWARSCHTGHNPFHNNEARISWHATVRGVQRPPFILPRMKGGQHFYFDPSAGYRVKSYRGWSDPDALLLLPRADSDVTALGLHPPLYQLRALMEMPVTSKYRGIARICVDGWGRGAYFGPFNPYLLYPGKAGMDGSVQFEILREGLQECETRIAIVKRNVPSAQVRKLLDRRTERSWVLPPRVEGQRISEFHGGWRELSAELYRAAAAEFRRKPATAADWVRQLKGTSAETRARAAWALGNMGPAAKASAGALVAALKDPESEVGEEAMKALAKLGGAAAPELAKVVAGGDPATRAGAARALARIGPKAEPAVGALSAALKGGSTEVRLAAAGALGRVGTGAEKAVPALSAALEDKDTKVRGAAATALGWIGPGAAKAATALAKALKDKDAGVRRAAAEALLKIGPGAKTAVPSLVTALKDKDRRVRAAAAAGLGGMGPAAREAVGALCELTKDRYYLACMNAVIALGRMGPAAKAAIPVLEELAKKRNYHAREALKRIKK